jgi:hypothetical protein
MMDLPVSGDTVRWRLGEHGYKIYVARTVPFLTEKQKLGRLKWAEEQVKGKANAHKKRIYSDECYVNIGDNKGRVYVTRTAEEAYKEACLVPKFQQSTLRVMIWSFIGYGVKGPIVVLEYVGGKGGGIGQKEYEETTLEELKAAIKEAWASILQEKIDHYILSMPDHVQAVITAEGGHTKY